MEIRSRKKTGISILISLMLLCFQIRSIAQEDKPFNEIPVGVILDLGSWAGKTTHSCITMAISDFYAVNSHYKTRIILHNGDTQGEPLHALSAALNLLEKQKVQAIIGSESTSEAKLLVVLGDEARVPILSLSPTPSSHKHPYFFQITQDETIQFKAISAMAESFGWKQVIVICEDTDNGRYMAILMTNAFKEKSISVVYRSLISTSASNGLVQEELHKLSTMQTKIFIMHTSHSLASSIFPNAKYVGMMDERYKWIVTSMTMNFLNFMDDEVIESMQGVVGFKSYIPQSKDLHNLTLKWRKEDQATNHVAGPKEINAYSIWAYDAISALAMALEIIKDMETTQALRDHLLRISFHGLGGDFRLMDGRITADILEIVNMIGKVKRRVGFWSKDAAFTRKIRKLNSNSDSGMESIIWPGGITTNQMHRVLQMSTKILKFGVPITGWGRVFQVRYDHQSHSTIVSGFCGDVFNAALNSLSHDVAFQFIPFAQGNYNDLIDQVYIGEFDAVIGDITITANRSLYVDFTLPFTNPGLATLTRNTDLSMWIFMKPLNSYLWLASACFFLLLGFVVWILEHRTNEEFQGSAAQQIGTTLWFTFSTLVYAHRHNLQSNLSRFVVTIWLFVVIVLASTYTATLSSLLTIEQIGNRYGPLNFMNFDFINSSLILYSTLEEYADVLSRGSKRGGSDMIIDEIPYIKEFLTKHPSGYSMTVYDAITNGFGFAFRKGSSLAPEMSRQILKLREDGTLKLLENKWFSKLSDPQPNNDVPAPKVLNPKDLCGLFLISVISMAATLFIFVLYYVYRKMHFTYAMLAGGKLAFILRFLLPTSYFIAGRR